MCGTRRPYCFLASNRVSTSVQLIQIMQKPSLYKNFWNSIVFSHQFRCSLFILVTKNTVQTTIIHYICKPKDRYKLCYSGTPIKPRPRKRPADTWGSPQVLESSRAPLIKFYAIPKFQLESLSLVQCPGNCISLSDKNVHRISTIKRATGASRTIISTILNQRESLSLDKWSWC